MSYEGKFAENIRILQEGVYGKDVRQAIYELFMGHDTVIASIQFMIDEISGMIINGGGGQNQSAEIGLAICGPAAIVMDGAVIRTSVTKKI